MTLEALFLSTIDDLDRRLELCRGEYDALRMAWLLRRLFHPSARSLVSFVNDEPRLDHVLLRRVLAIGFRGAEDELEALRQLADEKHAKRLTPARAPRSPTPNSVAPTSV